MGSMTIEGFLKESLDGHTSLSRAPGILAFRIQNMELQYTYWKEKDGWFL